MRFSRSHFKKQRKITTPSKLAGAKRALKREREKFPLLADWISAQQPTAQQRADEKVDSWHHHCQFRRNDAAASWRRSRTILRQLPLLDKQKFLHYWNNAGMPGTHEYFADCLSRFLSGKLEIQIDIPEP